jgi:hypothetical protein
MKKYILGLLLSLPYIVLSQNSWINIELLTDTYPSETTWKITPPGGTPVLASNDTGMLPNTVYTQFLEVGGQIVVEIEDSFGDGLDASQWGGTVGYFHIWNTCQDTILFVEGNFGSFYTDTLTIAPCAPPDTGCMDPLASNYNPNATFPDNSCLYDVDFTLNMNSYPGTFTTPYVAGTFNGWTDQHPLSDPDGDGIWETTIAIANGPHLWKFMLDNWVDQELPPNVTNNPLASCFILDQYGFTNRTLLVQGPTTLDDYCWESCYDCGTILGCTDSTSNLYNPWATQDDGSCGGATTSCGPGETTIEIRFTPDNYPAESGFKVYDDFGLLLEYLPGSLTGLTPGIPSSDFICVDTNILIDIVLEDTYGDGLCGTCFGGTVDGNLQVFDCDGNELFNLQDTVPNGNFGYQWTSPQFNTGSACSGGGTSNSIAGCTNPFSTTYNPLATVDDGTCGPLRVVGCTDTSAFNYDPNANTSEIMTGDYTLEILDGASNGWGGTWLGIKQGDWLSPQYKLGPDDGNSLTFNVPLNIYEPIQVYLFTTPNSALSIAQVAYNLTGPEGDTILDVPYWGAQSLQFPIVQTTTAQPTFGDVCVPKVFGCTDSTSLNYDPLANTDDGSCIAVVYGCTNPLAFNYDSLANTDDGSCISVVVGCMDPTSYNFDPTANTPGACIPVIYGCTDPTSFNYNPNANTDDSSCVPIVYGCTDPTAFNYDSLANTDDGTCIARVYGCTDSTMLNYDPLANTDNGTCIPIVYGCMNPSSINYNPLANVNDGSCIPFIYGCTDSTSFNYNPLANADDSSCVPIVYGCTTPTSINYNPLANTDDGSCIQPIYGCTDSTSFNYNPLANTDNGTCIPVVYGCTTPSSINYNPNANVDDSSCIPIIYGCTDTTAFNYNPLANTDNGSCIPKVYGCTNPLSINYNPLANTDDGSCIPFIYGCTDSTSFNYNPLANTDDGSCVPFVYGCTDPNSFNYDPNANTNQVSATDLSNPCIPIVYGCTDSTAVNYDPTANVDNGTCITAIYGCTDPNAYNYNPNANVSDTTACLYDAGCIGGPGVPYWLNDPCYAWVIGVDEYCCTNEWDPSCQGLYDYCADGTGTTNVTELIENGGLAIYPNPTETGLVQIDCFKEFDIVIYNSIGQLIFQEQSPKSIDLSKQPSGVYYFVVTMEGRSISKKVIKQQ